MLIVDDQPDLLRLFSLWVQGTAETLIANDATTALAMLERRSFDVVVTDFDMPGHTGLWLLERVRERAPATRRVLMSGNDAVEFTQTVDSGLVEAFLQKPLYRGSFLQALRVGQSGVSEKQDEPARTLPPDVAKLLEDAVTSELRNAAAQGARVMVILRGDLAAGKPVRVCEGTPTGFRAAHDGRERVVLTTSEDNEQLILVERIVRVAIV